MSTINIDETLQRELRIHPHLYYLGVLGFIESLKNESPTGDSDDHLLVRIDNPSDPLREKRRVYHISGVFISSFSLLN